MAGIYKITNLNNGKIYIGQSKNIPIRWKTHTQALSSTSDESVIRMAFAKYGLRQQISSPGIYNGFKFEILEKCHINELLEKEKYYIETLKPEYNISLMQPSPYFKTSNNYQGKYFLQYHSLEKLGYFPDYDENIYTNELDSGIFSKKRICKDLMGAIVVIILGCKPGDIKKTQYYLWSITEIESIEHNKYENNYNIFGFEELLEYPINLNACTGFDNFRMKCGNFAYGLQPLERYTFFHDTLKPLLINKKTTHEKYHNFLQHFCDTENAKFK